MSHLLTVGFRQETHKKTAGVKRDHNRLGGSSPYIEAILKHIAMPFRGGDHKESSVLQYGRETRFMEMWPSGRRQQVANLSYAVMRTVSSNLTVSAKRSSVTGYSDPQRSSMTR